MEVSAPQLTSTHQSAEARVDLPGEANDTRRGFATASAYARNLDEHDLTDELWVLDEEALVAAQLLPDALDRIERLVAADDDQQRAEASPQLVDALLDRVRLAAYPQRVLVDADRDVRAAASAGLAGRDAHGREAAAVLQALGERLDFEDPLG